MLARMSSAPAIWPRGAGDGRKTQHLPGGFGVRYGDARPQPASRSEQVAVLAQGLLKSTLDGASLLRDSRFETVRERP